MRRYAGERGGMRVKEAYVWVMSPKGCFLYFLCVCLVCVGYDPQKNERLSPSTIHSSIKMASPSRLPRHSEGSSVIAFLNDAFFVDPNPHPVRCEMRSKYDLVRGLER